MSDTIIMYENGKAIGGEGHPTNADEITFDNTGTDIVANKTGSAIKEVNAKFDKGRVSVTANGNKTNAAMFGELAALLDFSKLTENSVLRLTNTIYHVMNINVSTNVVLFTAHSITSNNALFIQIGVSTTPANCYIRTVDIGKGTPPTWTYNDTSSNVVTNGQVYSIIY